ncbi:hypothetical protein BH10PSE4_BH10PSE4_24890 [soil metagenome]
MAQPPRSNPDVEAQVADRIDALQAMLTIMQQRPQAFDPAALRAVWTRLGVLAFETSGARRVA